MEKSSKFEGQYIYLVLEELELYDCDSEGSFLRAHLFSPYYYNSVLVMLEIFSSKPSDWRRKGLAIQNRTADT